MKNEILSETRRDNWADADDVSTDTTAIENAINGAIRKWQRSRFYFNESRSLNFTTVIGQIWYSSTDDADIPKFVKIDELIHVDSASQETVLRFTEQSQFESQIDNSAATGEPYNYAYFNMQIGLYPKPDAANTIRIRGHYKVDAPATDSEANNVWMVEAFDLIKAQAKAFLYRDYARDAANGEYFQSFADKEARLLRDETGKRVAPNTIRKATF